MEKLLIIDTSAVIYKSHYAMENLINSKGQYTGAIFGLVKQLEQIINKVNPKYTSVAYDVKRSSLKRVEIFSDYKANRKPMPEELVSQLDIVKEIIKLYGISSFEKESYEADDIIATLADFGIKNGLEVHILTGDKDLQQLITKENNVFIHLLSKDIVINTYEDTKKYMGVYPNQIVDLFGLMGDKADGIPGVAGIGGVTGEKLISEYNNLENIYENIENIKGKLKEKLIKDKEIAYISRELAKVEKNIDLDITLDKILLKEKNKKELSKIFKEYELKSLLSYLNINENVEINYENISLEKIKEIIKKAKKVAIYDDERFFSCCVDKKVYIYEKEEANTLFYNLFTLQDLDFSACAIVFDAKKLMHKGVKFKDFFDTLIASYVVDTNNKFEVENIIEKYTDLKIDVYDSKKLKSISIEAIKYNNVKIVYGIYILEEILKKELAKHDTKDTYNNIEKPLIEVLYKMEKRGIKISKEKFNKIHIELKEKLINLEQKIYKMANEEFNIDSPSQLSEILFDKMGIYPIKKTKRGYSTDAEVLEELSLKGVEIAEKIIEYRAYKKLLSTYIEPLPNFADSNDRIHTTFNATGTVTGRLSSINPNLQNIPTNSTIRECFVAEKGKKLLSLDYSQIELRVLAELSKDEKLIEAYKNDMDLHRLTAEKLFPYAEKIDKNMRNIAKTINFSVLYGKTPFGLSKELRISMSEAKDYINKYFEEYSKVPLFIDEILEYAKKNLYVETLFGTRRHIREINSNNKIIFEQAKRMAINTVVQGTAANIIKKVMIELDKKEYNMLVQVHDELIFEIDEKDSENIANDIRKIMENTIIFDNVKLKANYAISDNWGDLK